MEETYAKETFGQRLKKLRIENSLTQPELSFALEAFSIRNHCRESIAQSTISAYEQDKQEPTLRILRILAEYFNVSMEYLACMTNSRSPESLLVTDFEICDTALALFRKNSNFKFTYKKPQDHDAEVIYEIFSKHLTPSKIFNHMFETGIIHQILNAYERRLSDLIISASSTNNELYFNETKNNVKKEINKLSPLITRSLLSFHKKYFYDLIPDETKNNLKEKDLELPVNCWKQILRIGYEEIFDDDK